MSQNPTASTMKREYGDYSCVEQTKANRRDHPDLSCPHYNNPTSPCPSDASLLPPPATFSNASLTAYCAVVYVIWPLASGEHKAKILMTKSRMAPNKGKMVLQAEICGLVVMRKLVIQASLHLAGQF